MRRAVARASYESGDVAPYRGDGRPAAVAGRAAAAVAELGKEGTEEKAPRVDGARCALRMRRGHATISVRQAMRYVDAPQTRVAKKQGAGFLGR